MKSTIRIHENAKLRALAAMMIMQAVRDLTVASSPFKKRLDAFLWLTGPDFEVWADWSGLTFLDPYEHLLPNLRDAKRKLHWGLLK